MRCAVCDSSELEFLFHHHHDWQVRRCTNCGLTQVAPRPTSREVAALYEADGQHFDPYKEQLEVHRQYFRLKAKEILGLLLAQGNWHEKLRVSKKIPNKTLVQRGKLLDIGCALGVFLTEAKSLGFEPYGVDISEAAVAHCCGLGLAVVRGILGGKGVELPSGNFAVVTAFEIIEHERDPKGMMRQVYKLLQPGGIVVVTTPNHASWWRMIMGKWWLGYRHPEHLFFFDPKSVSNLLRMTGFSRVVVRADSARPFPLSFAIRRTADYFPLFKRLLEPVAGIFDKLNWKNPFNPWADMIVVGVK